ncbi:hypothetical protein CBM2631_B120339 [Cupriavidus taiwanensis]|nr:hypothetical protein CBM2588_B130004 [Cupriavidus taiwanensis]SOZ88616.1 hypothetical protein CBM2622_B140021 [Cupriavidus taiwanensis]SOZ93913.1 hypothetical protein CBM2621_B140020 [Cupriavidus taiwanensis]SPA19660.1 hypothetical protein CBM2631_B120339 [Cupriavidus taiwanensis]SPD57270.1 protein of unknown function [Cupriavidus taiwanensis]
MDSNFISPGAGQLLQRRSRVLTRQNSYARMYSESCSMILRGVGVLTHGSFGGRQHCKRFSRLVCF